MATTLDFTMSDCYFAVYSCAFIRWGSGQIVVGMWKDEASFTAQEAPAAKFTCGVEDIEKKDNDDVYIAVPFSEVEGKKFNQLDSRLEQGKIRINNTVVDLSA